MKPKILLETKDLVVLDKPAGLLVHGIFDKHGPKHSEETLVDWLVKKYPEIATVGDKPEERPGIVHRLDKETSGVIVVARNQATFDYLKKLFQNKEVKKMYTALVWGDVKNDGVIDKPISIKSGSVKRTIFKGKMPREAITHYTIIKKFNFGKENLTLLAVSPKTGRTHQIRVHLSSIGHPIVGDKLYGKRRMADSVWPIDRQFLHASKLEFTLENGEKVSASAPLPSELAKVLTQLEPVGDRV